VALREWTIANILFMNRNEHGELIFGALYVQRRYAKRISYMTRAILVIFFSAFLACSGTPTNVSPQEPSINLYEFLNLVLTDTVLEGRFAERNGKIISDVSMLPPPINTGYQNFTLYLSDILSEPDTLFVKEQLKDGLGFKTDSLSAYGFKIARVSELRKEGLKGKRFWERVYKEYGRGILTVSRPVFDKNLTRAYIRMGHSCGSLCGGGVDVLLEEINGRWKVKEVLSGWNS
jgi:hypothetical protein